MSLSSRRILTARTNPTTTMATTTPDDCPEPSTTDAPALLVTTTKTKDYLGVSLVNAVPGTSAATDYLGRAVVAGDKDYMGRGLVT